ncbi:basic amino acid/polyamine antiporter [Leifsonia poae]|uniref:Amino acid APC transporter n=1 Tax=Leifsonia poae TaxID=110933 RepID=A0A9W6M0P2_9MICO|nr:basic amino acid/polyamine antiporter [Leifsonia poae]GLJ76874.1 amino acid APC transporter [Leifsonia poae]
MSTASTTEVEPVPTRGLPVPALAGMVVGSMVGAGVFSLPSTFAAATGAVGAAIAWTIAGLGMLTLVFVFQRLAVRKPELDAGIYAYAKAGFGDYVGFFSAFGYWASACAGNVTYWVLIGSTLGGLFPAFGAGNTVVAVAVATGGLWLFHFVITRGVRQAAILNSIVTVAKLLPLLLFVVVVAIAGFNWQTFTANLWGGATPDAGALFGQIQSTMLVTVFVFLGVEGATVYSRYARCRRDVGRATLLGFLSVLALFVLVSILSFGVLPRGELAGLRQPSVAGVLEAIVGPWGYWFISIGLIVSVLGAYLAWSLMAAEVLYTAAKSEDAPRFLTRTTRRGVPIAAMLLTTTLVQALLIVTIFSNDAFDFMLKLCSSLALIPYLLTAGYALKLETRAGDDPAGRSRRGFAVAALATIYALFLVIAGGPTYLLVSFIIYAPGTVLYVIARRERGLRVFTRWELVICIAAIALAAAAVVALATGAIVI